MMSDDSIQPKPILDEIATIRTDIEVYPGFLNRLENPDVVITTESAGKGLKLYDEVDRDPQAGSVLQTRYLSIVGKEWEVVPVASKSRTGRPAGMSREKMIADFVSGVLGNCNFDEARRDLLQGILYGFYVCEIIWKASPGAAGPQITIDKLICKHPRRFIFSPERELRLITWENVYEGIPLPDRKFFVFRYGETDNPYGKGLGQRLFWPVWFKKNGIKFWSVYLERFGAPLPVGKFPPGSSPAEKTKLLNILAAIQVQTGIIIPDNLAIDYLEAKRAGSVDYNDYCKYMDHAISKTVLGQTASTEGTPGRLGNDKTQQEVRQDILEADADLLDMTLNENLIPWIVDYNFPGVTEYPKIKTYAAPKPDLEKQSQIDQRNIQSGAKIPVRYFYETYGYPEPQAGEEIAVPQKNSPAEPSPGPADVPRLPAFSASKLRPLNFDETDDWIQVYMDRLRPALQNARINAQDDVETWLKSLKVPPTENELQTKVADILGSAYASSIDRRAIASIITEIYKTYRESPSVAVELGGADIRSINFLSKLDNFYFSKWIENPDAQAALHNFITEHYLTDGAGLWGSGKPEDIQAFRDLLGQKIGDIEDWQIRRIIDTSVTRVRNWGALEQLRLGGIAEIQIVEPTHECDFCTAMNGRIIDVATAYKTMADQSTMTPEEYGADLKEIPPTVENISALVDKGQLPPYHPHCRGIVIKRMA